MINFKIDTFSRKMINSTGLNYLFQKDNLSEKINFEIDKMIDGQDMSVCSIEIHTFIKDKPNIFIVKDKKVENDILKFTWGINRNATFDSGVLNMTVIFKSDDIVWHTEINSSLYILPTIDNENTIIEENVDLLKDWEQRLKDAFIKSEQKVIETAESSINRVEVEANDSLIGVATEANKILINIKKEADEAIKRIEDKVSQQTGKPVSETAYSETFFKNFFAMQRTGKKYTVRFPLWETSQDSNGEKLDDNLGLIIEPSTILEKGRDDYENIPLFRTYDCNIERVGENLRVTAMKGDAAYNPDEKDTFVLGMPYYQKVWNENGYLYISRSDIPCEGYVLCPEAKTKDGSRNFCVYAKYLASKNKDGVIGSYRNKAPLWDYFTYDSCITEGKKRGKEYNFGASCDYAYIQTTFMIKYAKKNWNEVLGGVFDTYSYQYATSLPESNTKRVILTNEYADKFPIGSGVSLGNIDQVYPLVREDEKVHSICKNVKVINIEKIDDNNKALVLDIPSNISTVQNTKVTSMYWLSGFSDMIRGRDGCPCNEKSQIGSLQYPSVIQGIELCVGTMELLSNAFILSERADQRAAYVCNDITKLSSDVMTARANYIKMENLITAKSSYSTKYGTEMYFDCNNGINIMTKSGDANSGNTTGFCDSVLFVNGGMKPKSIYLFGNNNMNTEGGIFAMYAQDDFDFIRSGVSARLSLNLYKDYF